MSNSILIIDDERAIRKTLSEILSYEGFKVDEAADGEEGWKLFSEKNYDVVLCDIKMPKLDGLEFLIKATEKNPDIPVIMISGHGTIETAVDAVKKGAYDYVAKPPDLNRLLITIRNALDKNKLSKETRVLKRKVNRVQEMIGESGGVAVLLSAIPSSVSCESTVLFEIEILHSSSASMSVSCTSLPLSEKYSQVVKA